MSKFPCSECQLRKIFEENRWGACEVSNKKDLRSCSGLESQSLLASTYLALVKALALKNLHRDSSGVCLCFWSNVWCTCHLIKAHQNDHEVAFPMCQFMQPLSDLGPAAYFDKVCIVSDQDSTT